MRSKSGTKLYAVRDESGQFKDIQTYKRAHAADLRQKSAAEKEAAQGPIEKKVRKAAKKAVKSVKSTVKDAVAAVKKAAKQAMRRVSSAPPAGKAVARTTRKPAAKAPAKVAAKKAARKVAAAKQRKTHDRISADMRAALTHLLDGDTSLVIDYGFSLSATTRPSLMNTRYRLPSWQVATCESSCRRVTLTTWPHGKPNSAITDVRSLRSAASSAAAAGGAARTAHKAAQIQASVRGFTRVFRRAR